MMMGEQSLASRLADVQVSVRADLKYTRQVNRDGISYIVHHPITFQNHRLSSEDYLILSQLRGKGTLSKAFQRLVSQDLLTVEQEEDFYGYVVHLNQLNLLQLPISDARQLHDKFKEKEHRQKVQTAKSFLFFRIPLFEPMPFLDRTLALVQPMFTKGMLAVWLLGLSACFYMVFSRWAEFSDPLGTMLATSNFPILWGLLLGLKVIHEFGHAYACRNYGAKVPEMGAFFLMGSPCAYMDASDSWNLTSRRHRLIVAMGGMYFESWFAMLGIVIWYMTEPSLLNSIAQYTVVLSTIITIGFNVNPLMKYDGYYALCDLLGRPLLREDASYEFSRIVKRVLFGLKMETRIPNMVERVCLILFGLACSLYRLAIAISIATVLGMFIPLLGSLVLTLYVGSTVIKMVKTGVVYLRTSPEIADRRPRAWIASGIACAGMLLSLFLIPVPGGTRTAGVVVPEKRFVAYASSPGFLDAKDVTNGMTIAEGAMLCRLSNPDLERSLVQAESQVRGLELQLMGELSRQSPETGITQQQLRQARESLAEVKRYTEDLTVTSPATGVVGDTQVLDRQGRYLRTGEPIATIGSGEWFVTSLLDEETFSDVKPKPGDRVFLTLASRAGVEISGKVVELKRRASAEIELPQLTQLGGGDIPVSGETNEAQRPYVELRIRLDEQSTPHLRQGQRALVAFSRMGSSIATVWLRGVRRLLTQMRMN